ncbi:MAG TPA: type II toxin-antitoxin system RelE/ParE family toxin [Gammaproteobacteria bacterium]|nr:type II toxin-antitoxin system RelE/ParE family toxin [Gammaproteobacteria bacterium]
MRVVFTSLANEELDQATRYYDLEFEGLGQRFRQEVRNAAGRISQYPEAWSVEQGEIRKCLLHKFPYKLLYSIENDHILIIAVAHQHRKPDYWVERTGKPGNP